MSLSSLGRRYERLLILAAPLALASLVTLFVVFATNAQEERAKARCNESAAAFLESKMDKLEEEWRKFNDSKKSAVAQILYTHAISLLLINTELGSKCYKPLLDEVENRAKGGSKMLVSGLRDDAKRLLASPIKYAGVDIPAKATIGLMGTQVSIDLTLFASLLQIVLAPLIFLWLGSLYNTRYRETLLIASAKQVSDIFPHLINVYPAIGYPEPKRRSWLQPYLPHIFGAMYSCTRIFLVALIIGPSVIAYATSIFLLESTAYFELFMVLGLLVAISSMALLFCELAPWHWKKSFPGRPLISKKQT